MAIDFPASPAVGQRYAYAGINYVFTAQGIWTVVNTGLPAASTSKVTIQKFTSSGSYVPTPGTQFAIVECIGAGGGGGYGNCDATSSNQGGGGGGGGYSRSVLTAAQIGVSQPVTVGVGGIGNDGSGFGRPGTATSFGAFCSANGGNGGGFSQSGGAVPYGGAGAAPGTGDIAVGGSPGGWGEYAVGNTLSFICGGDGGAGPLGGGATTPALGNLGVNGVGYGSGGSGGNGHFDGSSKFGGTGASGIVIVTEFNIAAAGPQGPVGPMGGTTGVSAPGGRLTLDPAKPVMLPNITNQATIYYLPYIGDRVPIFDGTNMVMTTIPPGGLSCVNTDTVKNPNAIGAFKLNDWFVWNDGGTIRLGHGPDWTSDIARSAGAQLVRTNGIWLNSVPITNGPGASRGTYVGTTRSTTGGTFVWKTTGGLPGGDPALLFLFNAYNRVQVTASEQDTTSSWTYNGGLRPANGSTLNRIYWVDGLSEVYAQATFSGLLQTATTCQIQLGTQAAQAGSQSTAYQNSNGAFLQTHATASGIYSPGPVGVCFCEAQESGDMTGYGGPYFLLTATVEI